MTAQHKQMLMWAVLLLLVLFGQHLPAHPLAGWLKGLTQHTTQTWQSSMQGDL
jgi:hypothetical protein